MKIETVINLVAETKRLPVDVLGLVKPRNVSSIETSSQLQTKFMTFGWTFSPELTFWAEKLSKEEIQQLDVVLSKLLEKLGLTKNYNPFFQNFEKGGFHPSDMELFNLFCFYGKNVTHTFEEYQKNKEEFIENHSRYFKMLNLGLTFKEEVLLRTKQLVESSIPLSVNDLEFISSHEEFIPNESINGFTPTIKENLALLNKIKHDRSLDMMFSTSTDLLRFVAAMNSGDVTLTEKTKFKKFPRKLRKTIFKELNSLMERNSNSIADALSYREEWKRIGEKIHPHESKFKTIKTFFDEIRGDTKTVQTVASKLETVLLSKDKEKIFSFFKEYPSFLGRNLDRVLRENKDISPSELQLFYQFFSSKIIISLIQHLRNRDGKMKIYTNKKGKSYFEMKNSIEKIDSSTVETVIKDLKEVLKSRIKSYKEITVSKELETVALPTSDKLKPRGIGILPIGSETPISDVDTLRFFIYWHQNQIRTDYDLSTIFLDKNFNLASQVSFTRLGNSYATHSGDITSAPLGASEFIDIKLNQIPTDVEYIIPQINVFSGEKFDEAKEVFFGFMERNQSEKGLAFEPKTVKFKSELQGKSQLSLPLVFMRRGNKWVAKWMHLSLNSFSFMGMVEKNSKNASLLVKSIVEKDFFKIGEIIELYKEKQNKETQQELFVYSESIETENLKDVKLVGQNNLQELIP